MTRSQLVLLILILALGLFFRTYKIVDRMDFGHDADLYSWIVKDIVINHHFRLIGQLTSAPGIFIGGLFYYLLIPFFLISKMDPIGALIPITLLGIFTMFSYYYVFTKLFNRGIGLIGVFLYAVSLSTIDTDRWVVPTVTTSIWSIWYFYTIARLSLRDFSVLPILGILIGLIWHIHIALAPILITIPIALFCAGKFPKFKQVTVFLLITFLALAPFIAFEAKHNFSQIKNIISNFTTNFHTDSDISEIKEITFGKQDENAKLNLNPASKFSLEVEPQIPKAGAIIYFKITSKNPKYSTIIIFTDCGTPKKFETGSNIAKFQWSTVNCNEGIHKMIITAKAPTDPFLKIFFDKFINVLGKENTNINNLFIFPLNLPVTIQYLITIVSLLAPLVVWRIKSFTSNQLLICYAWIFAVFLFFSISSIIVSEYYLSSMTVILILSISVILSKIYQIKTFGKYFILSLLLLILIRNFLYFISFEKYNKGYLEKRAAVQFIAADAKQKGFPCIGINYTTAIGENVGFRYFFYLNKLHLVHPSLNVPVYNIVIPDEFSTEVKQKFGHIGIIPPTTIPSKETIEKTCQTPDTNLTDSIFGYVD